MRILVTGTNGQVSTSLQERCAERDDIDLIALGRPDLDLDQPANISETIAAHKPHIVVSAAAWTAVDLAEDEPDAAMRANGAAAGEVARGAAIAGAPVIHLSTDYVFDGTKAGAWVEDDPVNPLGVYGRTKLTGERQVAAANPRHVILRTAWVYSPFGKNFVKTMLALAATRDTLTVVDDQYGCPTSAFDIADAILAIADEITKSGTGETRWGTYHLAGTGTATWYDFAEEIFRRAKERGLQHVHVKPVASDAFPTKAERPRNSRLDCTKLEKAFGFKSAPWQEALSEVVGILAAPPLK